ncbi:FACT complex subunit [Cryptotrichosporon argae]
MSHVTFDNIFFGDSAELGKLRFNPVGFGWKSYKNEDQTPTTFNGSDVRSAQWLRVARNFQLRLFMRSADRPRVTFDGFKREDHDKVKRTIEDYFSIKLDTKDISLKGWNWGKAVVQNNDIVFEVQHKTAFELPLAQVANSNIAGKNEVAIEFNPVQIEGASSREPDELVEIRLYVPGKSYKSKGSDAGSDAEDETDRDEDGNEISAAEALHNTIKDKADIGAVVGDSIVVFDDVLVLTPRGRYSLEFFHDSVRLLGKSTDYRVPFTSIHRIFLLPKLDDLHRQIILGLDPPIRQGATRYPFLVAQWPKDEEVDAELNITDEELAKYPELQRKYEAPTASVVSRVLKSLTGKKITTQGTFSSAQGVSGIKANVKAVQGELYFLERSLIFIAKQPILIDFNKTESVSFSRVGGGVASARTFDMRVVSKSEAPDYVFSSISKEEVEPISTYLQSKGVRLKNEMDDAMDVDDVGLGSDDDDDDASIPSEDDKKGKKKEAKKPAAKRDDDDDESDDEDFASESSDGGSPSESDSESDAASDASDPMMEDIKRRQAARAGKTKKGDESSGDEKPKKKKKKTEGDD